MRLSDLTCLARLSMTPQKGLLAVLLQSDFGLRAPNKRLPSEASLEHGSPFAFQSLCTYILLVRDINAIILCKSIHTDVEMMELGAGNLDL